MTPHERGTVVAYLGAFVLIASVGAGWVYAAAHRAAAPVLLHAGTIVERATEKIDGHEHCFVTITAKDEAGHYYKRTGEVNCWIYRNDLSVGSWWQFTD